jgi:malate dehydrogenase
MQSVAIIGAGELGGAVAHVLARRDVVRSIVLIDESGRVAAGKALDVAQAAPVEQFSTDLSGSTDVSSAAGAAFVILADRAGAPGNPGNPGSNDWQGDEGLLMLRRVAEMAPGAVILCAGASQRELVDRGVRELHLPRTRLFGSAPEAFASGARALAALAVNGSPRDVALSVLGVPPAHLVIPWESATVAGRALSRAFDEPARRQLTARIAAMWPPGPYALASAATAIVESMTGRSRRLASCFVAPDTTAGTRTRTAALPVRLGASGIVEVVLPTLTVVEQVALDNAVNL